MDDKVLEFRKKYIDVSNGEFEKAFKEVLERFTTDKDIILLDENEKREIINKLVEASKEIDFSIIPYASITTIIFSHDESKDANNIEELGSFLKECFGIYYENVIGDEKTLEEYESQLIVIVKFIEHLELAINQKNSLYKRQNDELEKHNRSITDMDETLKRFQKTLKKDKKNINDINENYENMLSQYISILGIFAAILMTAFGAIQGFTAIYSKENSFSLADSILIASIGFMGVLLLVFYLMNSISKMTGKSLDSNYGVKWYNKHPTLINSFIILSTISLICIAYKVSINPPVFSCWGVVYIGPIVYFASMSCYFNRQQKQKVDSEEKKTQSG